MPPLPDVANVLRLDLGYLWGEDQNVLNRLFLHFSGAASTADLLTYCGTIATQWASHMAPTTNIDCALTEVKLTDLTSSTGAQALDAVAEAGTKNEPTLGADSAVDIRFAISRRYRGGKPKAYLPGPTEGDLADPQTFAPSRVNQWLTAWRAFMAAVVAGPPAGLGTVKHVNVSYFHGFTVVISPTTGRARNVPVLRGAPVVDDVTAYSMNARVASQRRRTLQSA